MKLGFNLDFDELDLTGLKKLDQVFLDYLFKADKSLHKDLMLFRSAPLSIVPKDYSEFLLKVSPYLDDFLADLFCISKEVTMLRLKHKDFNIIYECKRKFVQRYAIKRYPQEKIKDIDFKDICLKLTNLVKEGFTVKNFAKQIIMWQQDEEIFAEELEIAAQYAAYQVFENRSNEILFNLPQKLSKESLIDSRKIIRYQKNKRMDFNYTDSFLNLDEALNHSHYCIYCHKRSKDSCSKGFIDSQFCENEITNHRIATQSPRGCPLRQKISELNYVKAQGFNLSALAIIVIDNPTVAVTGHRICNDCLKACIYQKQDPVNIPLIESNILEETLKLPYGLEIYLLLTRWNPLNICAPLPKESTNYNILVTGLGPAGFSLSYYLLRSGHNVIAIDGLKIPPMPFDVHKPIKFWHEYKSLLSERVPRGFGGVVEYGITVRFDKNNLDILRLLLERNSNFRYYDGVVLGSNITKEQALELGFDHIAFCIGSGAPKILEIENFEAKGVKTASDFLMTLQSGGAFLKNSNTNMVIRMPIAIIGGGLTSIDVATESLYYYKMQVERFFKDYELAVHKYGKNHTEKDWTEEDKEVAEEFITHAKLFEKAKDSSELRKIFNELGGATIYYRAKLQDSPAYKLNHEELMYAMALGINFAENMQPLRINTDKYGHVESVEFQDSKVKAKTVIMAVGIENNIQFRENEYSYFGDCNPKYSGSVVKALASTKEGYENINKRLINNNPKFNGSYKDFCTQLDYLLVSKVQEVNILNNKTFELIIHSPLAAKNFKPGQFFRLQNYSSDITKLIEPLALSVTDINVEKGLISFIIYEVGKSTSLCKFFSKSERVVLMGPTGVQAEVLKNKKIVVIDSGFAGTSSLLPLVKSLKENNCEVIFFTGSNLIDDIKCYVKTRKLTFIDRVIINASPKVTQELQSLKNKIFGQNTEMIVNVNSSMQCMMKGVCGQCIQKIKGKKKYIFACSYQSQKAEIIDFKSLKTRLYQNSLQEKMRKLF